MSQGPRPGSASVAEVATRAAVLRRLELEVLRRLDGIASGDHLTTGIGPGSERAGAREYEPGDDARLIDWNLTARSAATYVRTTDAEREVDTWIVADRSASLDFGTARAEKRDVVLGAAAAFGMLTVRGHNRLGVLVAGTERSPHHPPRTGRVWLMAALRAIHDTPRQDGSPTAGNDIAAAMRRLLVAQQRRSQIVVVSDFLGSDAWVQPMRTLALHHQVSRRARHRPARAGAAGRRDARRRRHRDRTAALRADRRRRCGPSTRPRPQSGTPGSRARSRRAAPSTCTCPPRATGSPTRCCSRRAAKAWAAPSRSGACARAPPPHPLH